MQVSSLSLKLIELRKLHNYTQADISNYLNISRSNYSQYENGYYIPNNELLLKLTKLYQIDIAELINTETVPVYVNQISDNNEKYDSSDKFSIAALNEFFTLCKIKDSSFDVENITQDNLNILSLYKQLDISEQNDLRLFIDCKLKNQS